MIIVNRFIKSCGGKKNFIYSIKNDRKNNEQQGKIQKGKSSDRS